MSKYINTDDYKKLIEREKAECYPTDDEFEDGCKTGLGISVGVIDEMPPADVAEVKHGEWENKLPDGWQCSECFEIIPLRFMAMFCWGRNRMNFCPNCGADMRGEENG